MRFSPTDRAVLAALLHRLPRQALRKLRLLVRPDTVLRWHRDLLRRRHAKASRPKRPDRPRTIRSIRILVLRLATENPIWATAASTANSSFLGCPAVDEGLCLGAGLLAEFVLKVRMLVRPVDCYRAREFALVVVAHAEAGGAFFQCGLGAVRLPDDV